MFNLIHTKILIYRGFEPILWGVKYLWGNEPFLWKEGGQNSMWANALFLWGQKSMWFLHHF